MRVLLVDDHCLILEGLSHLLAAHAIPVVGAVVNGREAVSKARALKPDVILMDLKMPECDGLTATRLIKAEQPEIQIVILTTSVDDEDLFASIQSGACGYLLKSIRAADFIEALRGLEEGAPPFSPGLAARLLKEFARLSGRTPQPTAETEAKPAGPRPAADNFPGASALTDRQANVLRLVASGLTYKEVGRELALSERTVRYHMAEIMGKLHLEHRSQVLAYAGTLGLGGTVT